MRSSSLNLAAQPVELVRSARRLVRAAIVVLLVSTVVQAAAYAWVRRGAQSPLDSGRQVDAATLVQWQAEVDRLTAVADGQRTRATVAAVGLGNQLVSWRTIPWLAIFAAVEEAMPERVRLEAVEPVTEADSAVRVVITAAARDPGPLLDLLLALEAHGGFTEVYPRQETSAIDGTYRINLQARYVGNAATEEGGE